MNEEIGDFPRPTTRILDFPEDLVRLIRSYQPINIHALTDQIGGLKTELSLLQRQISEDKKWREDFKDDLDGLLTALKEEKDNRQTQFKELEGKITVVEKGQISLLSEKSVWDKFKWAIIGALIAGAIALGIKYGFPTLPLKP